MSIESVYSLKCFVSEGVEVFSTVMDQVMLLLCSSRVET